MTQHISTREVLRQARISRPTLERWLASGKLKSPRTIQFGATKVRIWTQADIKRVKELKQAIYRKGRGRKRNRKTAPTPA